MKSWFSFGVLLLLIIVEGCVSASIRSTGKLSRKSKDSKVGDETVDCVMEVMAVFTSPTPLKISPGCKKMVEQLRSDKMEARSMSEDEGENLDDELNALLNNQANLKSSRAFENGDDEEGDMEMQQKRSPSVSALKYLFSGKNGDEEEPISADDEDEGEEVKEDDPLFEDYLDKGDDDEEEEDESLEFGKPFLTSLDDVDGKFLVIPLHVTGGDGGKQMKERATAAAEQRRSAPYGFNKLSNINKSFMKPQAALPVEDDSMLFDDFNDDQAPEQENSKLEELAQAWADLNAQPKQDIIEEEAEQEKEEEEDEETLFKIEMDLEKLNADLESLKRPQD